MSILQNLSTHSLWQHVPVIVRAILTGAVAATIGTVPWAILASTNMKYGSVVPWAVPLTALYLWFYWRFMKGEGWPRSTGKIRRLNCRANRLPDDVWGSAILSGFLGLVAVVLLQNIISRMVRLPASPGEDLSHIPFLTLLVSLVMSSIVAGVVEEVSFRGYIQGPIERRHGPVVAMLVTGSLFGFAHFTHPEVALVLMPWYIAIGVVYGTLAYLTNSILPGLVLHATGNMMGYIGQLANGRAEWQTTPATQALIWEAGTDVSFWISCLTFLAVAAAAVWSYMALAKVVKKSHDPNQLRADAR